MAFRPKSSTPEAIQARPMGTRSIFGSQPEWLQERRKSRSVRRGLRVRPFSFRSGDAFLVGRKLVELIRPPRIVIGNTHFRSTSFVPYAEAMETITHLISTYGYSVIFVAMTLDIVFLPVPEETLMIFCPFL